MHNVLANGKWPNKLKAFWNWLWGLIQRFNVQVLMGDFNMLFTGSYHNSAVAEQRLTWPHGTPGSPWKGNP